MRSSLQAKRETQALSVITLFCYTATFVALFTFGYSLTVLTLPFARQQIGSMYLPFGM